ncbi:hypothetical protein D3C73_1403770 [compost metagenome]
MQQTEETLFVGAAALDRFGFTGFEQVLEHRAQEHRGNQQDGREQRATQGFLIVFANPDQVDHRDQHHQQDRQVPEPGKYPQ